MIIVPNLLRARRLIVLAGVEEVTAKWVGGSLRNLTGASVAAQSDKAVDLVSITNAAIIGLANTTEDDTPRLIEWRRNQPTAIIFAWGDEITDFAETKLAEHEIGCLRRRLSDEELLTQVMAAQLTLKNLPTYSN